MSPFNVVSRQVDRGFTLIEVLVTSEIISLLIALMLPSVQSAREAARRIQCQNHLRQLSLGLQQYEATFGVFPPGMQVHPFRGATPYSKSFGWTIMLLPYLERSDLYSEFDFNQDAQIHHRHLTKVSIATFVCPSDPNAGQTTWTRRVPVSTVWGSYYKGPWGTTNYLGVSGVNWIVGVSEPTDCASAAATEKGQGMNDGLLFGNSSVRYGQIIDGSSNTWLFGERGVVLGSGKWGGAGSLDFCPNGSPDVLNPGFTRNNPTGGGIRPAKGTIADEMIWWSWHPGGTHFAFADGSVRLLSYSTSTELQYACSTRSGNEPLSIDW